MCGKKTILLTTLCIVAMMSCQRIETSNPIIEDTQSEQKTEFVTREGQTVLGDVIDIPYSIENLLEAYENLPIATKSQIDPSDIRPTHYYVRFYPKSIAELDTLRNIKPYVFLSETPLDRKIEIGGTSYHDPSIPEDLPTYQYTVVPVDRWAELSETVPVESEILIKAYIPDYDEAYTTKSEEVYGIPSKAYEALLKEAYRITGNEYDVIPETKASWTPSGRVRAYDTDKLTYVPVKGVRIRGTHLLKVRETLTDINGYFTLDSFNNPVSLKIIWESDDWDIRDGLIGQAKFDGPQLNNQNWYCDIGTEHEKSIRYAVIQNVAYLCFYENINGLFRPLFSHKLKFCQHSGNGSSNFDSTISGSEFIVLYIVNILNDYKTSKEYTSNVAHEIGHSVHYSYAPSDYGSHSLIIRESWADFYSYAIRYLVYGQFENYRASWPYLTINPQYSPIFIDLFDDENQRVIYGNPILPNDEVSGYTWNHLNSILYYSYTLSDLKTKAKSPKPIGVTNEQIDSLFEVYEATWSD